MICSVLLAIVQSLSPNPDAEGRLIYQDKRIPPGLIEFEITSGKSRDLLGDFPPQIGFVQGIGTRNQISVETGSGLSIIDLDRPTTLKEVFKWEALRSRGMGRTEFSWRVSKDGASVYVLLHSLKGIEYSEIELWKFERPKKALRLLWTTKKLPTWLRKRIDTSGFSALSIVDLDGGNGFLLSIPSKKVLYEGSGEMEPITIEINLKGKQSEHVGYGSVIGALPNNRRLLLCELDGDNTELRVIRQGKVLERIRDVDNASLSGETIVLSQTRRSASDGSKQSVVRFYAGSLKRPLRLQVTLKNLYDQISAIVYLPAPGR